MHKNYSFSDRFSVVFLVPEANVIGLGEGLLALV